MDRQATLVRQTSTPQGTPGHYVSDSGFSAFSIEKPYVNDENNISCINPGTYLCQWLYSPKHNCNVYHVKTNDNRIAVEIHSANVQEQLQGCIALGATSAIFTANSIMPGMPSVDSPGVTNSVETMAQFEKDMRDEQGNQVPFWITIV